MAEISLKAQIIEVLQRARGIHEAFIRELTEVERAKVGLPDNWAAKDILEHATFWQECTVQRLDAIARNETPPNFDDFERLNQDAFEARRHRPWSQVSEDIIRAFEAVTAHVQKCAEADLAEPGRYPSQPGVPLWRSIVGNAYMHPVAHFADFYLKRGEPQRAIQLQETMVERVSQLADGNWRGTAIYNLACFYALAGEAEKALGLLADSLRMEPSLVEWSKQDPDLISLHELPTYQALYAS